MSAEQGNLCTESTRGTTERPRSTLKYPQQCLSSTHKSYDMRNKKNRKIALLVQQAKNSKKKCKSLVT